MTAVLAVLASRIGVEEKRLLDELDRRGVACRQVDTRRLALDIGAPGPQWRLALNREIGFHRAVQAARGLEALGVTVVNSAAAIETCGDKWRTTLALRRAGLPVPRTALALGPEHAVAAIESIGYPVIVKPLIGSWGRLVTPVPDRQTAESITEHLAALAAPHNRMVYIQRMIRKPARDLRVLVVGGEVAGAVYRYGEGARTNIALGGRARPLRLGPDLAKLAIAAADAVEADIAGVDVIEDEAGEPSVLEVNHRVEFAGLQSALGDRVDVAARIVDHLVAGARR